MALAIGAHNDFAVFCRVIVGFHETFPRIRQRINHQRTSENRSRDCVYPFFTNMGAASIDYVCALCQLRKHITNTRVSCIFKTYYQIMPGLGIAGNATTGEMHQLVKSSIEPHKADPGDALLFPAAHRPTRQAPNGGVGNWGKIQNSFKSAVILRYCLTATSRNYRRERAVS